MFRGRRGLVRMSDDSTNKKISLTGAIRRGFSRKAVGLQAQQVAKIVLAETLADKRREIKKKSNGAGGDAAHNAAVGRFAKDRARSLKKSIIKSKKKPVDLGALTRDRTPSPILDGIDPNRVSAWKRMLTRRFKKDYDRVSLKRLNFLDFPVETMHELTSLSRAECSELNAFLDFDDKFVHDMGIYLVIAEFWPQLNQIFVGGRMSLPVQKVLDAVGLSRDLNFSLNGVKDHSDIWPFEIRRRRTRGSTTSDSAQLQPQGREQLNDRLVDLIDEWLVVASREMKLSDADTWELTGEGKANIANMVGEILDNAERHSSVDDDGDWTMAAFMARRDEPDCKTAMMCYLAFLSVGKSIAETIKTAPTGTKQFCEAYASFHARPGQSYETLLTIAALQDGVTSAHSAAKAGRGGTGLQDTLDFVGDLGGAPGENADVRVTIVSGSSCIRLRHPILVGKRDGRGRRVQWCNEANDPTYPPDHGIAFDLPAHFAGTLVSVAFTLDPSLFVPEGEEEGQNDD